MHMPQAFLSCWFWCFLYTNQVLELQLPGKKVFRAAAFWNGLRGQKLKKL